VALARAGKMLAVGDPADDVFAPDPQNPLPGPYGGDSGAVWLY
jgi:hypothetical protein